VLVRPEDGPMDSDVLLDRMALGAIAPGVDGRLARTP
jgi:hypothetical protein